MKQWLSALLLGLPLTAFAATDIDLNSTTCTLSGTTGVKLTGITVTGLPDKYNATLAWDSAKNVLGVASAAKNALSAVNVDFSASTCKLTGATGLLLRNIGVTGATGKYWAKFTWDSTALQFTLADYGTETSNGPSKKYLLSFHACDASKASCNDPNNHMSYVAQSDDGASWSILSGWTPLRGSVPDIIRRGNKLYLFSTGFLYRYSFDTNTWDKNPTSMTLKNASGGKEDFVDPSVILDDNGRLVLFFLYSTGSTSDPATCASTVTSCTKYIRSAVEDAGSDGATFTMQSGDRAAIALNTANGAKDFASDPDVFKTPTGYAMYVSKGGSTLAYSSATLHGTYTAISGLTNGYLLNNDGGVPAGFYNPDSKEYWTYAYKSANGVTDIRRAATTGISTTLTTSQVSKLFDGASIGIGSTYEVASPGFAVNDPY